MRPPSGSLQVITLFSPTSLLLSTRHTQPTPHHLADLKWTHTCFIYFIFYSTFNLNWQVITHSYAQVAKPLELDRKTKWKRKMYHDKK